MFNFKKNGVHVVKYRVLWMCLSALLLIPGIIAMIYSMITYPTHSPVRHELDFDEYISKQSKNIFHH